MVDGLDIDELTEFTNRLAGINDREVKKRVTNMLRTEGANLRKETIAVAKSKIKKKTGNYLKGVKRGKVYLYQGDTWSIRTYSTQPHAHLIEYGHDMVVGGKKGKGGEVKGYVTGKKIFQTAERRYEPEYFKAVDKMVDDILDEGLGF